MGGLLGKLGLTPLTIPEARPASNAPLVAPPDLRRRLDTVSAKAAAAGAAGGQSADEIKKVVADAAAAVRAAAGGDKAAIDKAHRAIDAVQMAVDAAAAAKPPQKYVPSPEAIQLTKHVKEVLGRIALLEAQKSPEAARLKKAAVDAAKLGQSSKTRATATAQLDDIDKQIGQLRAVADRAAKAAAAPKEPLFTMKVGGKQITNVTSAQACAELGKVLGSLESELKRGFEAHCEELKIQREEPFAAWVSGGITAVKSALKGEKAVDIDDLNIWDAPWDMLFKARAALKGQDVEGVVPFIPRIAAATKQAAAKVKKYNADAIESAETAVEIARKTEDVAADVIAKGAEKYGGEKAGIAAKAGTKSVFQLVEQLSGKYIAGTQKELDWAAVVKEGAASVASDLVGLMLKGAMAEHFSKLFGPYLQKAHFSEKELEAMAKAMNVPPPLNRDFLMTKAQRYVKDFVLDKAKGFVTDAVADTIKGKKANEPDMSIEELMKKTVAKVVDGKFTELFVDFVVEHAKK